MPFGQVPTEPPDKRAKVTWAGTEKSAREITDWGKDEAGLALVQAIPPDRNAKPDTPGSEWAMKAKVAVAARMGGGEQWVDVPKGASIYNRNTGPSAWTDPVLEVVTPADSAATFEERA